MFKEKNYVLDKKFIKKWIKRRKIKFDVKEFFNYTYYVLTATVTNISIFSVSIVFSIVSITIKRNNECLKRFNFLNLEVDHVFKKLLFQTVKIPK